MKILHVLSQRPDSTGSGISLQAMLREAACNGHCHFLVAGIQPGVEARLDCIDADQCRFVRFKGADLPFAIVGMSDVMPYASSLLRELSPAELDRHQDRPRTSMREN